MALTLIAVVTLGRTHRTNLPPTWGQVKLKRPLLQREKVRGARTWPGVYISLSMLYAKAMGVLLPNNSGIPSSCFVCKLFLLNSIHLDALETGTPKFGFGVN